MPAEATVFENWQKSGILNVHSLKLSKLYHEHFKTNCSIIIYTDHNRML